MNTTINGYASPTAFVSKGKQRLKQYNDIVYLNNNDEFEIELFNPTKSKVLAKIELNGNSIGNGVILRPGERIYLERYLDVAKKFLFETYDVDGSNNDVQKGIVDNGSVQVKFYNEYITPTYYPNSLMLNGGIYDWKTTTFNTPISTYNVNTTFNSPNTTFNTPNTTFNTPISTYNVNTPNTTLSSSILPFTGTLSDTKKSFSTNDSIETGRIEKGSDSKQSFTYDNSSFNSWESYTSKWKILPLSQKLLEKEDIKVFCINCGKKRKNDKDKYCSSCGTKFSNRTETKIIYVVDSIYEYDNKHYYLSVYNLTLDKLIETNKNKLIVINKNSLSENYLRAVIID